MEAAPFDFIDWSAEALLPLRDVLADAMDRALTARERWIFERLVIERCSIRAVALSTGLSKTFVHRLRQAAEQKLRDALTEHPLIAAYLRRHDMETS